MFMGEVTKLCLKHTGSLLLLAFAAQLAADTLTIGGIKGSGIVLATKPAIELAYRRLGIEAKVLETPGERALILANGGKIDGVAARLPLIEAEHTNLLRVPTPLITISGTAFALDETLRIEGWQSLQNYRLVTVRGYKSLLAKTEGGHRTLVNTPAEALTYLAKGRADIALLVDIDGLVARSRLGLTQVKMLQPYLVTQPLFHYLHSDHAELLPKVDAVLSQMEKSGELDQLRRQLMSVAK